ncbi:alpha-L-rhamnosidase C-terminal domain-containing protein [Nonomuraea angiospora]|uniref:alpha-L-rhamnosidase C-terminal domain-containing protein n=1 Tax=Nonomuraea angiospora TaxID=46172 RepID=UPI00332CBEA7
MSDVFWYNSGSLLQALNPAQTMVDRLDTPYGLAAVSWERDGETLTVTATVPPGTAAEVDLPGSVLHEVGAGTHTFTVTGKSCGPGPAR